MILGCTGRKTIHQTQLFLAEPFAIRLSSMKTMLGLQTRKGKGPNPHQSTLEMISFLFRFCCAKSPAQKPGKRQVCIARQLQIACGPFQDLAAQSLQLCRGARHSNIGTPWCSNHDWNPARPASARASHIHHISQKRMSHRCISGNSSFPALSSHGIAKSLHCEAVPCFHLGLPSLAPGVGEC